MYSLVHEWDDNFLVFFFFFLSFLLLVHRIDWDRTFANWCMMRCKLWWTATMNINLAAGVKVCSTPWTRPGELFKRTFGYNIWQCNEMGGAAGDERQQFWKQFSVRIQFLIYFYCRHELRHIIQIIIVMAVINVNVVTHTHTHSILASVRKIYAHSLLCMWKTQNYCQRFHFLPFELWTNFESKIHRVCVLHFRHGELRQGNRKQ